MEDINIKIDMNKNELKALLKEIITEVLAEQKYIYRTISPPEVVKSAKGLVNLEQSYIPAQTRLQRQINNRNIIETYISKMSQNGYQLVTDVNYSELPHGGNIVFRKPIKDSQKTQEGEYEEPIITEGLIGDEIYFEDEAKKIIERDMTRFEEREKKLPKKIRDKHKTVKSVKKTVNLQNEFNKQFPGRKAYKKDGTKTVLYKTFEERYIRNIGLKSAKDEAKVSDKEEDN